MTASGHIRESYQKRVDQYQLRLDQIERRSVWISRFRGLTFVPAAVLAICGWMSSGNSLIWYTSAAVFLLAFVLLAGVHENIFRAAREIEQRRRMNQIQRDRLDRIWLRLKVVTVDIPAEYTATAADLDLFGYASLFQLTSLTHTPFGRDTLRDWFLSPATSEEIGARQEALALLAPDHKFREELDLRGRLLGGLDGGVKAFLHWAESKPWLTSRKWLVWLVRAMTFSVIAALTSWLVGIVAPEVVFVFLLAAIAVNIIIVVMFAGRIHSIIHSVTSHNHDIQQYRHLFQLIADLPSESSLFRSLQTRMGKTPREPFTLLNRLMFIIRVASLRRDALFGIPYLFSEVVFLTDFHVMHWLESWQLRHGHVIRQWLETVGQLEAISSLATLAHDNPEWTLPVIEDASCDRISGQAVGHPLLADQVCVRNDIQIGPSGTFLLVTGSNMSGKSTLLRAIGLNVSLAQAGGPVCAVDFRLPTVRLATSMRIVDSLADGVSFFMAELKRLKQIVDQSRSGKDSSHSRVLYLLDEILQGTNSAERHIAVSRVIGHLVRHGSLGAVSTHDLELARSPDLAASCQAVHFRESIEGGPLEQKMTFDYRMRPGLAPTTNALKLLEFVGLSADELSDSA